MTLSKPVISLTFLSKSLKSSSLKALAKESIILLCVTSLNLSWTMPPTLWLGLKGDWNSGCSFSSMINSCMRRSYSASVTDGLSNT